MAWREQKEDIVVARISEDQAWARIQQKTFTRWCNTYLSERMLAINDLATDLDNGVIFINLLEEISGKEVARRYNKKPKIRAQKLENLKFCFDFLKAEKIKLVSVGPEDLADGNLKLILGLIWTLILRFQITQGDGGGSAKNALLEWVRSKIPEYNIKNFTKDWQDGKAICALANAVEPGVLDLGSMNNDPMHNASMGMEAASTKMDIPKVLDPEDMVSENPDEHANMTYISYFRDYLERCKSREAELAILRTPVPGKCVAYGPGLEGGEVGIHTEFTIEAINAKGTRVPIGGHEFRVILKDSKGAAVDTMMQDNGDGTYLVTYTPLVSGVESVAISLFDKHIKGSVFNVYISKATVDASQCEAFGPGLESAEVGVEAPFTVVLKNRTGMKLTEGGHPVDVRVLDGHGCLLPVQQTDNQDGTFSMSYLPNDIGRHEIVVSHKDQPIGASPFIVEVQLPDGVADHTHCYAEGPGLEGGNNTALPTQFTVHVLDKHGQHLQSGGHPIDAQLEGPDGYHYDSSLVDNNDGTLTCTYHAKEAGTYTIDVLLRSAKPLFYHHIKGSTFTVQIDAGTDAGQSYAYGPGLESGILDTLPTHFTIQAADRDGEKMSKGEDPFEVSITDAEGKEVPAEVKDNGDGTYRVDYKPNGPGRQLVNVSLRGTPIKDAPFKVDIKAGAFPGHCMVEKFTFVVQTKTAAGEDKLEGGEDFQCSIAGPAGDVEGVNVRDLGTGKYKVSYKLPEVEGEYVVSVTINGDHIKGSPWRQFV